MRRRRLPGPYPLRAALGGIVLALLVGCAVNPVTGQKQFVLMSEEEEVRLGEQSYPQYTQMSEGLFPDPQLQAYVQSVGARLAQVSHRPQLDYRFNVVNSSEINAYALPGGKISITRGLLGKMDNEAQLASVLGHEIGHVTARHAAVGQGRQVLAGILTAVGGAVLQGANVQGADLIAQGGQMAAGLVLQKYSRDQERQSDELGMGYMTAAGYNPEGMVQTMEILLASHDREPSALEALFASHPLSSERVATTRRLAAATDPALHTEAALRRAPFQAATARLHSVQPAYADMDAGSKALSGGDTPTALRLLRQATDLAPDQALIWAFRGAAEAKEGDERAGLEAAERAVQLDPGLYRARLYAGVLAFEVGDHRRSQEHLDAAQRLLPGQPTVTFFQGRNFEALGDRREAAGAYATVLKQLRQGPMAEYSYRRLVEWGYIRP